MRGSPILQAVCMVVAFLLAGWPVYRLTRSDAVVASNDPTATESPAASTDAKPAPLEVEAVFAPPPGDFQIKNLDATVLAGNGPAARFQTRWTATLPPEGVDLVVQAHWPAMATDAAAPGTGAVRVRVRFVDGRLVEKSFWAGANGTLAEVFTVPGAP